MLSDLQRQVEDLDAEIADIRDDMGSGVIRNDDMAGRSGGAR